MRCAVTAGPTYESLDEVRRLTNFSTGKFGTQFANFLAGRGHHVTLLRGYYAIHHDEIKAAETQTFTTTTDLCERLRKLADAGVDAIFHAAAVSDFKFGKIWERTVAGELTEARGGKVSTRSGTLLAELVPTEKLLAHLRAWHPRACLVGWKYEVDGGRADVLAKAERQIAECRTDACVANGKAYGFGFGLVRGPGRCGHFTDTQELYLALEQFSRETSAARRAANPK
ncbi:MAG: DNA/pantothenate metabolism flavoprotein domain protein [Verrucomicrobia bacterium]|nr:DNA/pantothenate metabolism flavoprotein domain protein [Verrucomicrobiota bacterium]